MKQKKGLTLLIMALAQNYKKKHTVETRATVPPTAPML
jgi:hypothetical protein